MQKQERPFIYSVRERKHSQYGPFQTMSHSAIFTSPFVYATDTLYKIRAVRPSKTPVFSKDFTLRQQVLFAGFVQFKIEPWEFTL